MEKLLTFEEYNERAINLVVETAKKIIKDDADDLYKWGIVNLLVEKCLSWHFMLVDKVNELFFEVFGRDRNGEKFPNKIKFSKKECKAFNSQPKIAEMNKKARESWGRIYELEPDVVYEHYDFIDTLLSPFVDDCNSSYHIAKEAFKRLYGHDYEIDRDYKWIDW